MHTYLCDPKILEATEVAYIEPRVIFDYAIERIENTENGIKKVFYNRTKLETLCLERYNEKVLNRLKTQLANITECVELV